MTKLWTGKQQTPVLSFTHKLWSPQKYEGHILNSSEIWGKSIMDKYNNRIRILWLSTSLQDANFKRQYSQAYQSFQAFTRAQCYWIFSCSELKLICLLEISVSIYKWESFQMWLLKNMLYNNWLEETLGQQCNLKRVFIITVQFHVKKNLHLDCPSSILSSEPLNFLHGRVIILLLWLLLKV